MRDRVADVLAQRATLDRGAGVGVALSLLFHAGLAAVAVYAALHSSAPRPAKMVSIEFASLPAMTKAAEPVKKTAPAPAPKLEEPKPVITEPKPIVPAPTPASQTPPPKPQKNTVPLSPFGQSTKKGSEAPAPVPAPPAQTTETAAAGPAVPVGGSGVTGLEGGDFPYTLYLEGMQRKIGTKWFRPTVGPGTEVVIYYRIQRDGRIGDVSVVKSSGNAAFDRAAKSAVMSSNPLTPLPFAYSGTYLGVHLTFR